MDPVTIILVIAGCIAGLLLLYFLIALTMFLIGVRQVKKVADDFDAEPAWKVAGNPRRPY